MNIPRRFILLGAILLLVGGLLFLVYSNWRGGGVEGQQFTLEVWGTESPDVFGALANTYKALRPGATIEYKYIAPRAYKAELLNALAADEGPDIFYIENHDIPMEASKLYPAPFGQVTLAQLEEYFPVVVSQNMVASGSFIYALPLFVDSMALLYNKDLFEQAGVVYPPKTWEEFQALIPKLTTINQRSQIEKAAAAIGGTEKSVTNGTDLLLTLIMQNTPREILADKESALPNALQRRQSREALTFYLQFANPASSVYTWNDDQGNSIESFAQGTTAMIFNYHSAIAEAKRKNPFLNVGAAQLPQIAADSSAVTHAHYYALAVSKQTLQPARAWDFVIQATMNETLARVYFASSGHPPALKRLIAENSGNPDLSIFTKSALIARSWYRKNNLRLREALDEAIGAVSTGQAAVPAALDGVANKLQQF